MSSDKAFPAWSRIIRHYGGGFSYFTAYWSVPALAKKDTGKKERKEKKKEKIKEKEKEKEKKETPKEEPKVSCHDRRRQTTRANDRRELKERYGWKEEELMELEERYGWGKGSALPQE